MFVESTINPRTVQAVIDAAARARPARSRSAASSTPTPWAQAGTAGGTYIGMLLREHARHRRGARRQAGAAAAALHGWAEAWDVEVAASGRAVRRRGRGAPRPAATALHEPSLALHVEDLTVSYHGKPVLWDIDVNIPPGVMAAIVGPNGAGKSTLIKAVLDLVKPTAGHVTIMGAPYREQRRLVGYVPQRSSVDWDFPTTRARRRDDGPLRPPRLAAAPGPARSASGRMQALAEVGMADLAKRQISQLSGGQQQRVFLARALVQEADIYFLDEPMAGVDATTERAIVDLLHKLRDAGKTLVVVHHDLQTVLDYFDWIVHPERPRHRPGAGARRSTRWRTCTRPMAGRSRWCQQGSLTGARGREAPLELRS